ncbi:hypothetical protein AB0A69_10885 [Streptomyces sp. NPDC045431]|uniref:hypothetical protein n=1 Tax=Streptomyces sp. NPDC045431 TaxID=3155613 RepID=UPI0033C22F3A
MAKGRGYRPKDVDHYIGQLSADRDGAWERAARLTVLAKEMDKEAARLREVVAGLKPQRYESLGPQAQQLLVLAEEEAGAVRAGAAAEAQAMADAADEAGRQARDAAR